jgi:HAD superfamily hydrolase (TIGR01549 family)
MLKNIFFDFDGVILDSMPIRDYGFKKIFEKFDNDLLEELIDYHNINGGLSRYVKIKYFYNQLLKKDISEKKISEYADNFSEIMRNELVKKDYLITDTVNFIKNNLLKYNFHIVSGSDEEELKFLCKSLEIFEYFQSINGSPVPKNQLVKKILSINNYDLNTTILIGDSINDYEAAKDNKIDFYGFNNPDLKKISKNYLENYKDLY